MRIIVLEDGEEWACNREGEGVFRRRRDGTWAQQRGTGQTPVFKTARQFSRYVHKHFRDGVGEPLPPMSRGRKWGWS